MGTANPPVVVATLEKNARERLRISLDHWRGHDLVDLRVCVPLAEHDRTLVPTKAGVSVRVALLPELIESLQAAEVAARAQGLLG